MNKRNQKPRTKRVSAARIRSTAVPELPASDPKSKPFEPQALDRTVIAIPLLRILEKEIADRQKDPSLPPQAHPVVIDLNLEFPEGRDAA